MALFKRFFVFLFLLLQIFEGEERSLESISAASCVDRSKKKSIKRREEKKKNFMFKNFFLVDFEGEI
jgi:hypothetical protein